MVGQDNSLPKAETLPPELAAYTGSSLHFLRNNP